MTIRTRLTLWYSGVFFLSSVIIGAVAYREFVVEHRELLGRDGHPSGEPEHERFEDEEAEEAEVLEHIVQIGAWFGLPAALLGLVGGWFLVRQALAPVAELTAAAGRITEHNLEERLPRSGNGDELDRLTEVFNGMTARLAGSFQRIREFTLNASHELKTPLTVLQGELEAASLDPELSAAHRERCGTQLDEVQRLAQIVDGLSLLTKADAGLVPLAHAPVRLDELVQDAFADAQILAQPREVAVRLGACEPLTIRGDRNRLRQLLLNLTDNAVKYNHAGGLVTIALEAAEGRARLTIENTGPGVPSDLQPRVFERFFRVDPSHHNEIEGSGLGLSTARWIVSAHRGEISFASEPGGLTTVAVSLAMEAP